MKHLKDADLENVLSGEVTILQKLDGAAFSFKKHNNKIYYFAREGKPISKEKLMTIGLYNEIIEFIESNVEMEDNEYVKGELFPENLKPIIEIKDRPKNNYIVFNTNMNRKYLSQYFSIVKPIFKGTLSQEQINELKQLGIDDMTPEKWTRKILDVLNKNFVPLVNREAIEGVVVITNSGQYKIVNPYFTNQIKKKKEQNSSVVDKRELYRNMSKIIFDQYVPQFKHGNVPEENITSFIEGLIDYLKTLNIDEEEPIEYMKMNNSVLSDYRGVNLTDLYLKAKGTKIENYIWFLFNAIHLKRKRATRYFSNSDIEAINNIRKYFGIEQEEIKIEKYKKLILKAL